MSAVAAKNEILRNEQKWGEKDLFSRRIFNSIMKEGSLKGGGGHKRKRTPSKKKNDHFNKKDLEKDHTNHFVVHIDRKNGWNNLIKAYKPTLKKLLNHRDIRPHLEYIDTLKKNPNFEHVIKTLENTLLKWIAYDSIMYAQLKNIAKILEIDILKIFLLQLMYEANTLCTSVVIQTNTGKIAHGRTMDWPMPVLEKLSVPISLYCNGERIGSSMQWLGCVGMFTLMRDNSYSITINYRKFNDRDALKDAESIIRKRLNWMDYLVRGTNWLLGYGDADIIQTIRSYGMTDDSILFFSKIIKLVDGARRATPVTFLMRQILMEETSYEGALKRLKETPIFSQIYFTIAGTGSNQGEIIARSTREVDRTKKLSPMVSFIVQPNMDWWDRNALDVMYSKTRIQVMNHILKNNCTVGTLWKTMKKGGNREICNDITVYSTLFVPSDSRFEYTVGH